MSDRRGMYIWYVLITILSPAVPPGIYYYNVSIDSSVFTGCMVYLKADTLSPLLHKYHSSAIISTVP